MAFVCSTGFEALCIARMVFPRMRATRIHHWLARRGFKSPSFRWAKDRYGFEFSLSPHLFLDRIILCAGTYDRPLHHAMERFLRPGMTCFDVGANIGSVTMHMAGLVGPDGQVFAFEPVSLLFDRLATHIQRNGLGTVISAHKLALADRDGKATIAHADPMTENQGMGSLVDQDNSVVSLTEEVDVSTLDSFVSEHGIESVDFIKVDIQGAEPLFIEGAIETLNRFHPLIFMEVSEGQLKCLRGSPIDIMRKMEALSYRAYEINANNKLRRLQHETVDATWQSQNILFTKVNL